jgi:hypothetical protein
MQLIFDVSLTGNDDHPETSYDAAIVRPDAPLPEAGRISGEFGWTEFFRRCPVSLPSRRGLREACDLLLADSNRLEFGRALLVDVFLLPWNTKKEGESEYHCVVSRRVRALCGWVYPTGERPALLKKPPLWQSPLVIYDEPGDLLKVLFLHRGLRRDLLGLFGILLAQSYGAFLKHALSP